MAAAEGRRERQKRKKRRDFSGSKERELLSHPWRVRVMEALYEREMSTSNMVDEGLIPDLAQEERQAAISLLSYHVRKLDDAGAIELVRKVPGRGSDSYIYRARGGPHHTKEQWAKLSRKQRAAITPMTLSSLVGYAELAALYGNFDNRVDRHLSYDFGDLDEQAWSELGPVLDGILEIFARVRQEAGKRLETSGEQPIRTVVGLMLFESPPLKRAGD